LVVRRAVALLAASLLLPLLVVLPAATSQAATGALVAEGVSAPAGLLWLPGGLGGHLWVSDPHQGLCRLDDGALAAATCISLVTPPARTFQPGQPAYDATNQLVYLPDSADAGQGVLVLGFDPSTETLSAPRQLQRDLVTYAPRAVTLGPDGALYVASSVRGRAVLRVVDRLGTPRLEGAANTLDGGPVAGLAFAGGDLYLAEQSGVTVVTSPLTCTGCTARKSEIKATSPQAIAADASGRLFVSDTPLDRSYVLRVDPGTGLQDLLASTGGATAPFLLARALTVHDGQVVLGDDPTGSGLPAGRGRIWTLGADDAPETAGTVDQPATAADVAAPHPSELVTGDLTAPAGAVRLGANLWVSDHVHGFCRLDTDGLGGFTLNQQTCSTAAVTPGQPAYDPQTNLVYVPDAQTNGLGVVRLRFDQRTNTVVDRTALAPGQGLAAIAPQAVALGPDGNLYVSGLGSPNVVRLTNPDGESQVLEPVGRGQNPQSGVHALAFVQSDLYLAEDSGLTVIRAAIGCGGACVAAATDFGVTRPSALVSDNAGVLYAADTPNVLTMVREIDLGERAVRPFVATGTFPGGLTSPLRLVSGLGLDPAGNLLVADDPSAGLPAGGGRLWQAAGAETPKPIGASPSAPSAPDLLAADDRGASSLDNVTNLSTLHLVGTSAPGTTVTLRADGADATSGRVGSVGTYDLPITLTPGRHLISAVAVNAFGRRTPETAPLTVTVDTTAPAAPPAPTLASASDTGRSVSDLVTASTALTVLGSAEPATSVRVTVDGTDPGVRPVTTTATGQYSLALASLPEGDHDLSVTATDLAGNTSASSPTRRIVVDTTAPAAPGGLALDPASDTGASSTDGVTGVLFPTVTGSAEPGAAVTVRVDDVLSARVEAGADGSWRATTAVNPGTHRVSASATDVAGNSGPSGADLRIVVDTDLPAVTGPVTALAAGRSLLRGRVPLLVTWHGTDAEGPVTGSRVLLSRDRGASWRFAARTGPSVEELLLRLAPAAYQLRVEADDQAGNTGALVGPRQGLWLRGDGAARYGSDWRAGSDSRAQGGRLHWSARPGATVRTTVTGGELGWVTTTGPNRGRAAISVDGRRVATVDLWSHSTRHGVLAFTRQLSRGRHTVTVQVLRHGTLSGGNRVDMDAFVGLS
jgi:hypothetical protein